MFDFPTTRIRPLSENIFTQIIESAGGRRAYPHDDRQTQKNADYILGQAVIELKILDDEGLGKSARQFKLASLFANLNPDRPVHVLDRNLLDPTGQRDYDRAMEGPIKGAVKTAKRQLIQSRSDFPETNTSILLLVNNANTALDHDEIVKLVSRRARNDTSVIDGVVVAGAYLHSDGFDTFALWPIDYVPIHLDQPFNEYDALRAAFHGYAERAMTAAIVDGLSDDMTKGPILDTGFEIDEIKFVRPAPPLSSGSDFYVNGRPRANSTGIETSPPVGLTFPELTHTEWVRFRSYMPSDLSLGSSFENWLIQREQAIAEGTPLKPFVPMSVTIEGWVSTFGDASPPRSFESVRNYANALFQHAVIPIIEGACDLEQTKLIPSRYILAVTEQIGQDQANDISDLFLFEARLDKEPTVTELVRNVRIFHLHACGLGAAYAVKLGVGSLRWKKDLTYSWS